MLHRRSVLNFDGEQQCTATIPIPIVCPVRRKKAKKPNGSKSGAKITGEQIFVRGSKGVDDFDPVHIQPDGKSAKPYQVDQFLDIVEKFALTLDDDTDDKPLSH
jgi:hypothetical protein